MISKLDGAAVRELVRPTEVHRDLYTSESVFAAEMQHLFANTWVFVGHDSQIQNPGDYITTEVGTQAVIMVRHGDDSVRVLYNRCAHKGTQLVTSPSGNTGKYFPCPYHAWTYETDGCLYAIPLRKGYDDT